MTPERLSRIRTIYETAVDMNAASRQLVLDRECNGDDELRQEVERLLGARERLPAWLSGPVFGVAHVALANGPSTLTEPAAVGHVHFPSGAVLARRYRIIYLLGRGGMGEVYRADDLLLGQPVALKFLPAASETALSRFRNEVRTARQVSHPNVCRVYDIGQADGLTYLSMEYVDGEDLASLLRCIGKLAQEKTLEIARQLCAGLAAAHDKGVIHRDLKPANIMLDGHGHVRITDFGIAGVAAHIRDVRSGTPDYMSPEQLAGKEVTPRSDIYAVGIVLCELMTGKRPPLQPADPGTTALDPAVERVIQRCLDPDPGLRPPSPWPSPPRCQAVTRWRRHSREEKHPPPIWFLLPSNKKVLRPEGLSGASQPCCSYWRHSRCFPSAWAFCMRRHSPFPEALAFRAQQVVTSWVIGTKLPVSLTVSIKADGAISLIYRNTGQPPPQMSWRRISRL
jgi:serine/threonine protein kinase